MWALGLLHGPASVKSGLNLCVHSDLEPPTRQPSSSTVAPPFPPSRSKAGASAVAHSTPSRALVVLISLKETQQYGMVAKVPVSKADDLNSIPSTQMAEGDNRLPQVVL